MKRMRGLKAKSLISPGFALKLLSASDASGKPEMLKFHSKTFNYVDRLDLMMAFLEYPYHHKSPHMVLLFYLQRLIEVQTHSCVENEKWDWQGFDVKKYHSNKEYKSSLYSKERQSIKLFHDELLMELRKLEAGLMEEYAIQEESIKRATKKRKTGKQ